MDTLGQLNNGMTASKPSSMIELNLKLSSMKLSLPIRDVYITQPFGVNYLDFYKKLGLDGHNGIDFRAKKGCPVLASHSGKVLEASTDTSGGKQVILFNKEGHFKTIYYHLLSFNVKTGDTVKEGQAIGKADNTGKYTTGDHLHFGLKMTDKNGDAINLDNGYRGAIDPAPFFELMVGYAWDKPSAYHRYGRKQDWKAEFNMRFMNPWLHKQLIKRGQLKKIFDTEFINALVYGGWDFDAVINPAMHYNWAYLKKSEYLKGERPFE